MWQLLLSIIYVALLGGLGAATLLFGRRFFWLGAVAVGFASATAVADYLALGAPGAPGVERDLLFGLLVASICGAVTWWRPRAASALIGFGVGIYAVVALLAVSTIALPSGVVVLLAVAVGVVCAWFTTWDTNQALIVFSVLLGASMIVRVLPLSRQSSLSGIVWLSLLLVGIIVQYRARLRAAEQTAAQDAAPQKPLKAGS